MLSARLPELGMALFICNLPTRESADPSAGSPAWPRSRVSPIASQPIPPTTSVRAISFRMGADRAATVSHENEIHARRRRFVQCDPHQSIMSRAETQIQRADRDGIHPSSSSNLRRLSQRGRSPSSPIVLQREANAPAHRSVCLHAHRQLDAAAAKPRNLAVGSEP
jgi:hypothetical protein